VGEGGRKGGARSLQVSLHLSQLWDTMGGESWDVRGRCEVGEGGSGLLSACI
jgi:hypothetical protein